MEWVRRDVRVDPAFKDRKTGPGGGAVKGGMTLTGSEGESFFE